MVSNGHFDCLTRDRKMLDASNYVPENIDQLGVGMLKVSNIKGNSIFSDPNLNI